MLKKDVLIVVALLVSSIIYAGTPGMGIRCGPGNQQSAGEEIECGEGFYPYFGNCYPYDPDQTEGYCDTISTEAFGWVPFFIGNIVGTENLDAITICVPDCSQVSCESPCDPDEDLVWSVFEASCHCEGDDIYLGTETHSDCDCPEPLVFNPFFLGEKGSGESFTTGACILPPAPAGGCYTGALDVEIPPIDCDNLTPSTVVSLIIRPGGGGSFDPIDVAVTLESIINCDVLDGQDPRLIEVLGFFGGGVEETGFGFLPETSGPFAGAVVIDINIEDLSEETILEFGGGADPVVIPPCMDVVPTLGEWAIISLMLILMIVGVVRISQPETAIA